MAGCSGHCWDGWKPRDPHLHVLPHKVAAAEYLGCLPQPSWGALAIPKYFSILYFLKTRAFLFYNHYIKIKIGANTVEQQVKLPSAFVRRHLDADPSPSCWVPGKAAKHGQVLGPLKPHERPRRISWHWHGSVPAVAAI